ncbi:Heat shock 70 kDa protein 12B [Psilocybe cubensis]|uniref:Heat shock 70 kDa protein 12B n=1 Tax=Psilocybe cubensis TaxID=181762 RepID=A0ACB8HEB4_PSICU|nr:Heat shock 70 kDa protein 12B [Psilocybe cubensis]KAH9485816.1 Heat shock 70 kDa protein 12B [Psilocybe cubensis]
MSSRSAYKGTRRRLVLAFDIGTTYSGISYSILDPGQVPQIKGVTRFPAHELISGASKIPTIIYYDQQGKVRAVGAEATREGIFEEAEDGDWVKAEWFKLHLRSKLGAGKHMTDQIPPLPLNKTVVEVFADFLRYMLECASAYIQDTHANGPALWASVQGDIDFVLSHPNGWEGKEQTQMRQAAVLAGLIPDTAAGHARVSFVTEGEASLHFAIQNGVLSAAIKNGEGIVIVDAGGGTVDVSSYSNGSSGISNSYEEIAPPQSFLEESDFIDDLDHIVRCFDKTTKPRFRNAEEPQYIKFGSTRDNDPECNIRLGQLRLAG